MYRFPTDANSPHSSQNLSNTFFLHNLPNYFKILCCIPFRIYWHSLMFPLLITALAEWFSPRLIIKGARYFRSHCRENFMLCRSKGNYYFILWFSAIIIYTDIQIYTTWHTHQGIISHIGFGLLWVHVLIPVCRYIFSSLINLFLFHQWKFNVLKWNDM